MWDINTQVACNNVITNVLYSLPALRVWTWLFLFRKKKKKSFLLTLGIIVGKQSCCVKKQKKTSLFFDTIHACLCMAPPTGQTIEAEATWIHPFHCDCLTVQWHEGQKGLQSTWSYIIILYWDAPKLHPFSAIENPYLPLDIIHTRSVPCWDVGRIS